MRIFCTLLLTALTTAVLAQSNYTEGYIIKAGGDTSKGFIDYREWTSSPRSITFKTTSDGGKESVFTARDIKGFGITGQESYITFAGIISMNKNAFPDLPTGPDTTKLADTVFLKQVVTGKYVTLYVNSDSRKIRYFIAETNATPVELLFYPYYNDQKQVINSSPYKGTLVLYASKYHGGDEGLEEKISNANYEQAYFSDIVNGINGDTSHVKSLSAVRFFIGATASYHSVAENGVSGVNAPVSYTGVSPKFNFGLDFLNNAQIQHSFFRLEMSLASVSPKYYLPVTYNNANATAEYQFSQFTFAITPQFVLNAYNTDKLKFYVDFGLGLNFSSYTNNKYTIENQPYAPEQDKPLGLSAFWLNYPVQAGIVLNKKLDLFLNYSLPTNLFKALGNSGQYSSYIRDQSVGIGIKFLLGK